jgi:hypothetical protein
MTVYRSCQRHCGSALVVENWPVNPSPNHFKARKMARTKTRPKGRTAGSLNKRTTQRLIEVGKQVAEVKKLGQKKATEVLNELVQTSRGMVGLYQRKVVTADGSAIRDDVKQEDVDNFWEALSLAIVAAKGLAPYQDPMISRIELSSTMTPGMPLMGPAEAGDRAKVVEGKVIGIDDPVALGRLYARAVNKVAC